MRSLYLSQADYAALRQLSQETGHSTSDLIRAAIASSLIEWRNDPALLEQDLRKDDKSDTGVVVLTIQTDQRPLPVPVMNRDQVIHQRQIPDPVQRELAKRRAEAGYHVGDIPRGDYGEPSKIKEETEEFLDAVEQGSSIMALLELSDLYGAMEAYLEKHHPGTTMADVKIMSDLTKRAFTNGHRS